MEGFRIPPAMEFSGNMGQNWATWIQKFELYMLAAVDTNASEEKKVAIFLNLIGDAGLEIFNTLKLKISSAKLEDVKAAFKKYCEPKKNVVFDRFKFLSCTQKDGQSITSFITEIKTLVKNCEYTNEDEMVRDKIIMGMKDDNLREKLLQNESLSLKKTEEICNIMEISRQQASVITGNQPKPDYAVDAVTQKRLNNWILEQSVMYFPRRSTVQKLAHWMELPLLTLT
ncbi:uncharacterized protein LOC123312508 [Coccinella septempunctata]|uniref:uncharacterized protein LOC123312508 n=2 Tax=Coccinella septempunctata TaxID=41139 RepID=UPI001D081976|nr:uncharacterized protein LOC123312508 [Coccinella septempunctata]XP_044752906.1 uncharacterized protein LOC123312508 [Coccinella septempunctata]